MEKIMMAKSRRMSGGVAWKGGREVHTLLTNGGSTGFSVRTLVQVVGYLIMFPLYVTYTVDTARCTAIHRKCKWRWFCYQLTSSLPGHVFLTDCRKLKKRKVSLECSLVA